ncbi:MAG: queuosine precursor transporter [Bacteroidia bacterium]
MLKSYFGRMILEKKSDRLFFALAGLFITNALIAEVISSKLIQIPLQLGSLDLGTYTAVIGILPWPFVFLGTDIINEFYGRKAVRRLSILTACLIGYAFVILFVAMQFKAASFSPASDVQFNAVFGQAGWIIIGSITAFLLSQLLDSFLFWFIRKKTGGKMIWLRSTGSTLLSQLVDSYVVLGIGFWLPGVVSFEEYLVMGLTNYVLKFIIAIGLTPFIYLFHSLVKKYLGAEYTGNASETVSEESLNRGV